MLMLKQQHIVMDLSRIDMSALIVGKKCIYVLLIAMSKSHIFGIEMAITMLRASCIMGIEAP